MYLVVQSALADIVITDRQHRVALGNEKM